MFVFGTRLTNITRQLRHRDVDVAMAQGRGRDQGLVRRNAHRRVPARVQLALERAACSARTPAWCSVSDGLDREAGEGLAEEMERLHKSCRELIWLNPLLRYDKFEARPGGRARDAAARRPVPAGA